MKKGNKIIKILVIIFAISSIFSVTVFAFFTSSDSLTNKLIIGNVQANIAEDFNPNNSLQKETVKKVKIENTEKNDELVRVSIIPRWVDENGNPWLGDTSFVHLNFNTNNVVSLNDIDKVKKDEWINGNDGYYYYSSILKHAKNISDGENDRNIAPQERYEKSNDNTKQNFTSQLLDSVSLNTKNMTPNDLERYKGKKLIIDVNVEAIEPHYEIKNDNNIKTPITQNWPSINTKLKYYLENLNNKVN